jgi:hypothetical protein
MASETAIARMKKRWDKLPRVVEKHQEALKQTQYNGTLCPYCPGCTARFDPQGNLMCSNSGTVGKGMPTAVTPVRAHGCNGETPFPDERELYRRRHA